MFQKKWIAIGCLVASLQAKAFSVSFLGLQDNSHNTASNLKLSTRINTGYGLLLHQQIGQRWKLTAGGLQFARNWQDCTVGSSTLSSQVLMLPMIFSYELKYLSFGLGGYYSQNQGNLSSVGSVNNSSLAYSSYGIKNYDYGYLGQVGLHVPLGGTFAFQLSATYTGGLLNQSLNQANTFQNRDVMYLAGVTIGQNSSKTR